SRPANTDSSASRNASSPSLNQSATDRPVRASNSTSPSAKRTPNSLATFLPTVVLPDPMRPTRTMRGPWGAASGTDRTGSQRVEEGPVVAHELFDRIAAELAGGLVRQHESDHVLGHHATGGDGGDIGALLERHPRLLGL